MSIFFVQSNFQKIPEIDTISMIVEYNNNIKLKITVYRFVTIKMITLKICDFLIA
jgi:hypothetical protein